jgi:DNA polymerase V
MDHVKMANYAIPFIDLTVPAGFPSPAADYAARRINLNCELIAHPEATYLVRCAGDSMIDAFIPHKCLLVVDRAVEPNNGDIVVAVINGEWTVKTLQKNEHRCMLLPANKKYPEILVTPEMNMQVWGVVTHIISRPKRNRT